MLTTSLQSSKLVTVFGASGFVGRHAVRALAKDGWRIRAVCRRINAANYLLPAGSVGQIQLVRANVNDDEAVAKAIDGANAVINLVGVAYGHGEQGFGSIHEDAVRRIARAAAAVGIASLAHVSAIGANPDAESSYASSKGRGERILREEFPDAVILRPSVVFGPEDDFFNKFGTMARFLPALPLIGGGHTRLQPVYVRDIAKAIRRAVTDPSTHGKTYELGGPAVYTFKDLMRFILRETGRKRLLIPMPFFIASLNAFFLQMPAMLLPVAPVITMDQVRLLMTDNVVSGGALTFSDLGIEPQAVEAIVPGYLWRFHPKGQFGAVSRASEDTRQALHP
jgi:uncharacterized protein YbjT (DUF2867 family)